MSNSAPISVVIPLYNKAEFVCKAIRTVLTQTWQHFEVIVVDDGSTDNGAQQVLRFSNESRVRLIRQSNRGTGAARNTGIANSYGDPIAFLDADDEWMPSHLGVIAGLAQRFPTAGVLATNFDIIDEQHVQRKWADPSVAFPHTVLLDTPQYFEFSAWNRGPACMQTSCCALRRSVYEHLGGFIEKGHQSSLGEDQEYWARVALHYPIAYDPATTSIYRLDIPNSALRGVVPDGWYPPVVRTVKDHLARDPEAPGAQQMRDFAAKILLNHVSRLLQRGKKAEGLTLLQDDILQGCRWNQRITRLRVGSHLPPAVIRAIVATRTAMAA
jgi:glycosyltransferase involved in cell wall biosynthesis